jgi:hypothetical protein
MFFLLNVVKYDVVTITKMISYVRFRRSKNHKPVKIDKQNTNRFHRESYGNLLLDCRSHPYNQNYYYAVDIRSKCELALFCRSILYSYHFQLLTPSNQYIHIEYQFRSQSISKILSSHLFIENQSH